ncbi:MAG: ATP-binding protein [Pseudomonadota bacterium]
MTLYEKRVVIPRELRLAESVFDLRLDRIDLTYTDGLTVDFSAFDFGEPLPLLLLAEKIKAIVSRFPKCRYRLIAGREKGHTYLDHIGFFKYIGWDRGRKPGEAWGSRGYIPIETFNLSAYRSAAGNRPVAQLINEEASRLAKILCQSDDGSLFDILQYAIREIVRNSAEHSRGERVTIFGQYWPSRNEAEIVVADDGVGIPETLYDNEYIDCNNAREALKFAVLAGVSGVNLGDRIQQDDFWGNSGFGLYVTSRICSQSGSFRMISDKAGLTLARGNQIEHEWSFQGTCIQMKLKLRDPGAIQKSIPKLIADAEAQQKSILTQHPIQASRASKMLASEFRKRILN